ncbi:hypothetical protein B0H13DRAFT_2470993 [Mycena leptocephala]|nr:hypothetical protein B0H13DRAFT_2470993 [Mycena leptocephala]
MENLSRWIEHIETILSSDAQVTITRDVELFLELEEENCTYYFVNHATCDQFWLEDTDTEELNLPPVISVSRLMIVLEEMYWVHVEHFPMHLRALPTQKLISILYYDQMTSRVSTFPYSARECEAFIQLLKRCKDNTDNGRITCFIGLCSDRIFVRLSHRTLRSPVMERYLYDLLLESSRLSRDHQVIFIDPEPKHLWISTVMARLDDVFVDHMVYADSWAPVQLVGGCLKQWIATAFGAFAGLLVLHLPFLVLNSPSSAFLIVSAALFLVLSAALFSSALGSSMLEHRYGLERAMQPIPMEWLGIRMAPLLEQVERQRRRFEEEELRERERERECREREHQEQARLLRRMQLSRLLETLEDLLLSSLTVVVLELMGWFLFLGLLVTILAYLLLIISFGSASIIYTPDYKHEIQRYAMTFNGSAHRLLVDNIGRMSGYGLRVVI